MQATLNILSNPFHPNLDRVQKPIQRKAKVNTLVEKHGINLSRPVLCYHNGLPLLRAQWSKTTVKDGDVVSFVYLPEGGGGSNPLKLVMMIAIAVYAPQLAATIGPSMGIGAGTIGMQMLSAGISFLGNTLVNALIPPPSPPKAQQQASMAAPSPTYSLNAQGNQARIGQAIPVLYGRVKVFPDFAAQPYTEFENNDQYLYQMFVVTQGKATIGGNEIFIEDTPITSFDEGAYAVEIVQPGSSPTLFPTAVYNASEVNGQELVDNTPSGPFSLNPAGTTVNKLAFDVVLPKGIYYIDDEGMFLSRSVSFIFDATPIDDLGNPIGATINLGTYTVSAASSKPIRKTYKFDVPVGRYSVTMTRGGSKSNDNRFANDLNFVGARGYASEAISYGNTTLLVVKLKATNNVSSQSSRKINCIAQRLLQIPTYNAITGAYDWSAETPTSSMAWAVADMCRAEYGANVSEQRYNIAQLIALDAQLAARGDEFNGVFDSGQTFWEALTIACRTGRTRPFVQGGMIHFVRDSLQSLPTALFTNRNIAKGTFKISYIMNSEDTADCVDIEYYDETMWKPRIVRAALDEGSVSKPAKVKAFGITNRSQAYREGMAIAAANRYRRKEITFETELEGHIPALGDLIAIQSDIPEWGQYGDVISYESGVMTVSQSLRWTDGAQHYVMLSRANGSSNGPLEVIKGASDDKFTFALGNDPDFTPYTGFEKERTRISFGRSGQVVQLAKVLSITPRTNTVQISAINEDVRVHSADGTPVPLDIYSYSIPAPVTKPILADFSITQTGSGITPSIALSWQPAVGASKYIIEKSTDELNWETIGEVTTNSYSFLANTGNLFVRVAAFGGVIGPYIAKSISVGTIPPPANVASGSINSNGQSYEISWTPVVDCDGYYVEVLNEGVVKRSFRTVATNFSYTLENAMADGGPWRSIQTKVKATKGSVYSADPLVLNGTNAAPIAPTLTLVPGVKSVSVTISKSDESDYAGTLLYAGDTAEFSPGIDTLIYEGVGTFFLHSTTSAKYYKAAHYDTYGKDGLNYSTVTTATPNTGFGVFIEYSVDGSTAWHSTYAVGDMYMRQKVDSDGTWSSAIRIVGADGAAGPAGAPGAPGPTGDSVRICYSKTTLAALANTPVTITTSGGSSFPANDSWGAGTVWASTPPTLAAGESLYQSDGIYSAAANQTIWGKPYLSSLKVGSLSAITANMGDITSGTITLDNAGYIRGGQTAYATGTGFFLGYSGDAYKFSLGNASQGIAWNGSALAIAGNITATSGSLKDMSVDGSLTIGANGSISRGQTAYNTGSGFWMGNSGGVAKFSFGNPGTNAITWDGSALTVTGDLIGTGNIKLNGVTAQSSTYVASAGTGFNRNIATLTVNESGGQAVIMGCASFSSTTTTDSVKIELRRDGVKIAGTVIVKIGTNNNHVPAATLSIHTSIPTTTGNHTYTIYESGGSAYMTCTEISLVVLEAKR